LVLNQNNYVATGGEGAIYRAGATVIKIYTDKAKMLRDRMPEKIKLLSKIRHKYIVAPDGLAYDVNKNPIGFYMRDAGGAPLPPAFTNAFRQRENFGDEEAKRLIDRMRETIKFAHDTGALLVDPNELNWLLVTKGSGGPEPKIIDVDSWQIKNWPAKVIMPSIRDWHSPAFSIFTDWFAWGIVTFQIFTGLHPYKGVLAGYKPSELERRMKDNASVFAKDVRLNHAVRDFNSIPGALLEWYKAAFQHGERAIPPSAYDTGIAAPLPARVMHITTTATGALVFEKLFEKINDPVIRIWPCGACLTASGDLFDLGLKRAIAKLGSRDSEVVEVEGGWLIANQASKQSALSFVNKTSLREERLSWALTTEKFFRFANRLFAVTNRGITEIIFTNFGKPVLSPGQTWRAMPNATKWFGGVGIQDAMGAMFLALPFDEKSCAQMRAKELDSLNPIAAEAGHRFAAVIALDKNGVYWKLEFAFDHDYQTYKVARSEIESPDINLTILPKGVYAEIAEDGELIVSAPIAGKINKISDKNITADMALANWENAVLYIKNGSVWSLRMK